MLTLDFLFLFIIGVAGNKFSDKENALLPRLFHLDDYDRCLLREDGLYCLGVFELSPASPPKYSPVYEHIKNYSSNPYTFNRTLLHRGYCVSERCPSSEHYERNDTLRFERCVNERARKLDLSASLHTLHHCTSQAKYAADQAKEPDSAQLLFLRIVYLILILNFFGTFYDVLTGDSSPKNSLIMAWSIRASWRRLTATYDHGDPRLNDLEIFHGGRVLSMLVTMYAHMCVNHFEYFVTNPNYLENLTYRVDGVLLGNGSSLIQVFVMISAFLTSYNLLIYAQKATLNLAMLPLLIMKRVIRIAPVHLLLVGYAATWWAHARKSSIATAFIGAQGAICRRKFWTHIFFVNNIAEPHERCLPPTWFVPVDMHLYILTCTLTILLWRWKHLALRIYGTLYIISSVWCGVLAYLNNWQSMIYYTKPEYLRGIFRNVESFGSYYTSSWGSLPACFTGLYLAHLHFDLQERKYNYAECKWLKVLHSWIILATVVLVTWGGWVVRNYEQPLVIALYVMIERPLMCGLISFIIIGGLNIQGAVRSFFGWSGWRVFSRVSLPVMMTHWLLAVIIAARPVAYHTSEFDVTIDYVAMMVITYFISTLISLLVEIPVQRFLNHFV